MVTKVIRELVCDLCESNAGVRKWRVILGDNTKRATADLCEACEKPLAEILGRFPSKNGRRKVHQVKTEAQVRAARKKSPTA